MTILGIILIIAVCMDLLFYKVFNYLFLLGLISGFLFLILDFSEAQSYLFGGLIPFLIGFPLYILKVVGAADVKMLMVIGLFLGYDYILDILIYSLIFAGILGVLKLLIGLKGENIARRFKSDLEALLEAKKISDVEKRMRIHMILAIALATIVVVVKMEVFDA